VKPILIYGTGEVAELAHYYFTEIDGRAIAGFTVEGDQLGADTFCGRPAVAFEECDFAFEVEEHQAFVALSFDQMNDVRAAKCQAMRDKGFLLTRYISPDAVVLTKNIGENALILENNTVQPFARIGDNATLWSGNHIGQKAVIGDNAFLASHIVVSGNAKIGNGAYIGSGALIHDNVSVGAKSLIGAGAIVSKSTEPESVHMVANHTVARDFKSTQLRKV
jgi:sugar O-acyltransferase (sialic acid O-acetyltransferase NeuD family)